MFQTEINLALQSAGSPPVTWLLSAVTLLGYLPAYVVALLTLAFAVKLRPGLALVGALLLTGVATEAAKDAVAFPRPDEVDPRVVMSAAARPLALAGPGGGGSFWAPPRPEAVEAVRRRATGNYGFPSGHVSATTAFLLCAAWFYRARRVLVLAAAWVPLMALSRLYLGRHFLADVLGGLALGVVVSAASVVLFKGLATSGGPWPERHAMRPLWLIGLVLLAATPLSPLLNPRYVGAFVGLGLSGAAFPSAGPPLDGGDATRRAKRVLVALALFTVTLLGTEGLARLSGGPGRLAAFLSSVAVSTATLAGTAAACRRLGLDGPRP